MHDFFSHGFGINQTTCYVCITISEKGITTTKIPP